MLDLRECMGIMIRYPRKKTILEGTSDAEEQVWYWYGRGVDTVEEEEAEIRRNIKAICRTIRKGYQSIMDRPYGYVYTGHAGHEGKKLELTIRAPWNGMEKLMLIRDPAGAWSEELMTDAEIVDAVLEIYRRHGGL